jgi:thioredoxin reductase
VTAVFDVLIIGAGPVGLYAATAAGEYRLSTALVDALPHVGGQLTALYPKKHIYDVPGYPKITAEGLVQKLEQQARQYEPTIELRFKVIGIERQPTGEYTVTGEDGRSLSGRYVVIAAGGGMIQPRRLDLADAEGYLGKGLEYVVSETDSYRDKRVLVVGGGDTALDWANFFAETSKEVTLVHRTDRFIGFEGTLEKVRSAGVTILTHTVVTGLSGVGKVERVRLKNKKEDWSRELDVDKVLVCIGFVPKLGFLKEGQFEISESSVKADRNMRTVLENVYAVGDISNHPGRIRLISTGFGDVHAAITDIARSTRDITD